MNRTVKNGTMVLLLVSFLLSFSLVFAQDGQLQPSIFIPKTRHDYGRVFEQKTYEYTFIVQNRGKADLVIESVKPG